jgi:hypothetical protein
LKSIIPLKSLTAEANFNKLDTQQSENREKIRPAQNFPSAYDEVPVHKAKQDQAHAMAETEADPRIPHRGLGGDAHRCLLHGSLQFPLGRVELIRKTVIERTWTRATAIVSAGSAARCSMSKYGITATAQWSQLYSRIRAFLLDDTTPSWSKPSTNAVEVWPTIRKLLNNS